MPGFIARLVHSSSRNLRSFFRLEADDGRGPPEPDGGRTEAAGASGRRGRNSRHRGASTLLVTFCNVRDMSKPVLATIGLRGEDPGVRWIEPKAGEFVRGATGLCFWNDLVCVAHQGAPGVSQGFVLLDPESDFKRVYEGTLPRPAGVHSVCSRDDDLYFVASSKDSVYRATLDHGSGEWSCSLYWTFPDSSGEADENHLNAIECVGGELYVSGFGKKEGDQWPSATHGFVLNIDRDDYFMEDVYHPHSLLGDSGQLWTCESARSRLLSNNGEVYELPPGYIRGLAINGEDAYVGSSKRRRVSESTGVVNRMNPKEFEGTCCVYKLGKGSSKPEILVNFSDIRNEIYEIMLL